MLDPVAFENLVSGQNKSWWTAPARAALRMAETPYTWVVEARNRRYDQDPKAIERVGVPVISVGNITAGGTGKTPLVAWLARWFTSRHVKVVLISRGYKAQNDQGNDEARELEQLLPDVPHLQNPDRIAAAHSAIDQLPCELIILDDAFQHRRIHRDLDIVLIDALRPFGHGHVLPRGLLREPLAQLRRASVIGLSRANAVDSGQRQVIHEHVARLAPHATWVELAHVPRLLKNAEAAEQPPETLTGQPVAAFCGIGNPTGFHATLTQLGCDLIAFRTFPDHCAYSAGDIASLQAWCDTDANAAKFIVCTSKDLVKLNMTSLGQIPLWALAIEMELTAGSERLQPRLQALVPGPPH